MNKFVTAASLGITLIPVLLAYCSPIQPAKNDSKDNSVSTGAAASPFDAAPASTAGNWTDVPYNPANFGCLGTGCTWTVTNPQQINYSYSVIGKTMIIAFTIQGITTK